MAKPLLPHCNFAFRPRDVWKSMVSLLWRFSITQFQHYSPRLRLASLVFHNNSSVNSNVGAVVRAGLKCIDVTCHRSMFALRFYFFIFSATLDTLLPMGGNHFKDLVDLLVVDHSLASTKHRKAITSVTRAGHHFQCPLR